MLFKSIEVLAGSRRRSTQFPGATEGNANNGVKTAKEHKNAKIFNGPGRAAGKLQRR